MARDPFCQAVLRVSIANSSCEFLGGPPLELLLLLGACLLILHHLQHLFQLGQPFLVPMGTELLLGYLGIGSI